MGMHPLLRLLVVPLLLVPAIVGCAPVPTTSASLIPPVPAGQARIWFYRDLGIYEAAGTPLVRLNGAVAGVSQPGSAFYDDVAPGHYTVSADSYLFDPYQTAAVDLAAGQQVYAKILPVEPWIQGGGGSGRGGGGGGAYRRDTFTVWVLPPAYALPEIAQSWFSGSGTLMAALPAR